MNPPLFRRSHFLSLFAVVFCLPLLGRGLSAAPLAVFEWKATMSAIRHLIIRLLAVLLLLPFCQMPAAKADTVDSQVDKVQDHFHFVNADTSGITHDDLKRVLQQANGNSTLLEQGLQLCALMDTRDKYDANVFYEATSTLNGNLILAAVGPPASGNVLQYAIGYGRGKLLDSAQPYFPTAVRAIGFYDTFESVYGRYQAINDLINAATERQMANQLNHLTVEYYAGIDNPDQDDDLWIGGLDGLAAPIQRFLDNKSNGVKTFDVHEFCRAAWRQKRELDNPSFEAELKAYANAVKQIVGGGASISYFSVYAPGQTTFKSSGSTGRYGYSITGYQWKLDGSNAGTTSSITRTFWEVGPHTISLSVTDAGGNTQSKSESFTVRSPFITVAVDPVRRIGTFSIPNNPLITSYTWDFGDNSTQSGASLNSTPHTYASDGRYNVRLTVRTQQGNDIVSNTVAAIQQPTPTTYTWTGASSQFWDDTDNWSPNGIPNELDTAIINGSVNISRDVTIKSLQFDGGNISGSVLTATGVSSWISGAISGTLNIPSSGRLNISDGRQYGPGQKRALYNGGTLNNAGTCVWTAEHDVYLDAYGDYYGVTSGGTINNSGTWDMQGQGGVTTAHFPGTFNNTGTLLKSDGYYSYIYATFNNSGTVNANAGTLSVGDGIGFSSGTGSSSGTFNVASKAVLGCGGTLSGTLNAAADGVLNVSNATLKGNAQVTGAGVCRTTGAVTLSGTVTVKGTLEITRGDFTGTDTGNFTGTGQISFVGGRLLGTVTVPVSGPNTPTFNWTGGAIYGTLNIPSSGRLNISGDRQEEFAKSRTLNNGGTLNNAGTCVWTGRGVVFWGNDYGYGSGASTIGGTINNSGTWDMQAEGAVQDYRFSGTFNNTGTLLKSGGNSSSIGATFNNSGAVNAQKGVLGVGDSFKQTAGTTYLTGGSISGTLDIRGGTLEGSGTISGIVSNSNGTVSPGTSTTPGILTISGDYTQTANGTLSLKIGGTNAATPQFDQLNVSGKATLGGALTASFINSYAPAGGASFKIVTHGTRTGSFASVNVTGSSIALTPRYNANDVTLGSAAPANTAPVNGTVSPSAGTTTPTTPRALTATYSDDQGASDINLVALRIGGSGQNSANSLLCLYNPTTNKLSIYNDAGTAAIGSVTPGTNTVLSNSQGSLNCKDVTTSKNGNTLTVNWNVSATGLLPGAFAGTKQTLFLFARDAAGLSDGYSAKGTWTLSGNVRPTNVSVSAVNVSDAPGVERFFTTTFTDPNGYKNLQYVTLRLGGSGTGSTVNNNGAMMCVYNVQNGKLYLFDDAGSYVPQAAFPNTSVVLSNSQGSLDCKRTVVTGSGTTLTIKWSVKAKAAFAGTRSIALICRDLGALGDGYDTFGTWTITGAGGAPASSSGLSTTSASSDGITLKFDRTLDATSAANAANYTLRINGVEVEANVEVAASSVTLRPATALHAGDAIEVAWHDLLDGKGHTLQGTVSLKAR